MSTTTKRLASADPDAAMLAAVADAHTAAEAASRAAIAAGAWVAGGNPGADDAAEAALAALRAWQAVNQAEHAGTPEASWEAARAAWAAADTALEADARVVGATLAALGAA